jgi:membrane associated rhomboid family serine protease
VSTLILINVAVFIVGIFAGRNENNEFLTKIISLHATDLVQPWMWWRTLTYGFVHDQTQVWHIFWNMFGLWMLGRSVEDKYGRSEFFRIYLVCIVFCGFGWLLNNLWMGGLASKWWLAGASGAVTCISMLFVLNFPRVTLFLFGVLPMPAWVFGCLLIGGNLLGERGAAGTSRVAYDVHLMGIAFAAIYFFLHWNFSFLSSFTAMARSWRQMILRRRMRVYSPERVSQDDDEADRILKKIHESGQDSLTSKERKFMERYSRQVRKRRETLN